MNLKKELPIVRELLNLKRNELAQRLDVPLETLSRWENGQGSVDLANIEKLYSFAYSNGVYLNDIFEQLCVEECRKDDICVLFHGSKSQLCFPLDFLHSKKGNDFGIGFYVGETFRQAATYICNSPSTNVYTFSLRLSGLKVARFNVDEDWMVAIAYYRGWLGEYRDCSLVKEVVERVESADVVCAPIADNRMFDIISEFIRGEITNLQCQHALSATNLGLQYVLRTNKALAQLTLLRQNYLCKEEKATCIQQRLDMNDISQNKVKAARVEYRGKGQYIEELLK